jgi:hypothetical protein
MHWVYACNFWDNYIVFINYVMILVLKDYDVIKKIRK